MNARDAALDRIRGSVDALGGAPARPPRLVWIARDNARWHAGDRAALTLDRANLQAIAHEAPALMTRDGRAAVVDLDEADAETLNAAADILERISAYAILDDEAYARTEHEAYDDALETIARDAAYYADTYLDETAPETIADAARDAIADALTVQHVYEATPETYVDADGPAYDADAIASAAVSVMLDAASYERVHDGPHRVSWSFDPPPSAARYRDGTAFTPYRNEDDAADALHAAWINALKRWTP